MMNDSILEDVYYTVTGEIAPEYRVVGIEDAFSEGGFCDTAWNEMYQARSRIRERLELEEDEDLNIVVDELCSIQKELCLRMFRLGWAMGAVSAERNRK